MISRNDTCWCGSRKKWKRCHYPNPGKVSSAELAKHYAREFDILIKTPEQIKGIRASCKLAAHILKEVCELAKAGVTTNELDALAVKLTKDAGAKAAPLGYGEPPFPKSICTSLNEVICHGIPDDKPLVEGDILNIDVTCILKGYFGDCSAMVCIGDVSDEKKLVVKTAYECMHKAIALMKPDALVSDIGKVIEEHAISKGCTSVNQFVGHGVGVYFHEGPQIMHTRNNHHIPIVPGMTFTIEPMINAGCQGGWIDKNDHWTARTNDKKPSAQWEHTLLITEEGHEILTTI